MTAMDVVGVLSVVSALFAFINFKFIKLPTSSGVMLIAMASSLAMVGLNSLGLDLTHFARDTLSRIDFHETLMNGMLSILLFAGALQVDLKGLKKQKGIVGVLSTVGLMISTVGVGISSYLVLQAIGLHIELLTCLLFGALISPTDPIAVLALLRQGSAPESVQSKIAGESLFNDGVGVVVCALLLELSLGHASTLIEGIELFCSEALGGLALGLMIGWGAYQMMKRVDNYSVEVLITLVVVFGGYSLARHLHTSGPLAMVVAGLLVGNPGRQYAMSKTTQIHLDSFWELLDEILNVFLFVIMGLEFLLIPLGSQILIASALIIPCALAARFVSIALPILVMKHFREFSPNIIKLMTWGGLRGAISLAIALSLPPSSSRDIIIGITYMVVVFSVGVQGTTFSYFLRKYPPR